MAGATAEKQTREGQNKLQAGLKRRHMTMISLGGIIGAGLFVGTGSILNQAGPATILTYALTGALLILIMRMLGERAVARPSVGSSSDYGRMAAYLARRAFGPPERAPDAVINEETTARENH